MKNLLTEEIQTPMPKIRQIADTLVLRRAGMYRVFAFLKKSNT